MCKASDRIGLGSLVELDVFRVGGKEGRREGG